VHLDYALKRLDVEPRPPRLSAVYATWAWRFSVALRPSGRHNCLATREVAGSASEDIMEKHPMPQSLDDESLTVERDVHAKQGPRTPVADLSGKGVYDSVSSNRSKMNDQAS
jgi:hypothetical protein